MSSYFDLISENDESTVVARFENSYTVGERPYMSERKLEDQFIYQLREQEYEYLLITTEEELIANLRHQIERLNKVSFSDGEWNRLFTSFIAKRNSGIVEKTRVLQEDPRYTFTFDNGEVKNIMLLDKMNIHENSLQVIRQYTPTGGKYENRYDVTILVNGLPMVQVELKRPGVDIREAFNQIKRYNRDSFWADNGLFEYVQIYVISNGTLTKYYSNTTRDLHYKEEDERARKGQVVSKSYEFTSWWTDGENHHITLLEDFTKTFFSKHTLLNILTRFCVFTVQNVLLVMRPYQIAATERILNKIKVAYNNKMYGSKKAGGYIWHTTGSGKTLTSFKTAQLASKLPQIDKVLFVVDRKDLDYQTMREYDNFQKDSANSNTNVSVLEKQLNDPSCHIIITTIQKLSIVAKRNKSLPVYDQHVVMIFDECHRSQLGDMHQEIIGKFKKHYAFGFTGTPVFEVNSQASSQAECKTTEEAFGARLHTYTIVNAIHDKNVLPFRMEYVRTMRAKDGAENEEISREDRERILRSPKYIQTITHYILTHFNQKTKRNSAYQAGKRRLSGFNSIFATANIDAAKLYYDEFKRQMEYMPENQRLKIAMIYSYGANDEDPLDGQLDDENPENTAALNASDRDALEACIRDYNATFGCNFSTSAKDFQSYYKDVSKRMKDRELDLLIVVNMFLTGFDAPTLNTLWADKNLQMHGLLQAYSRTNRILNSVKAFGNIVCFRNLEQATNDALALFGNSSMRDGESASSIALLLTFDQYFNGYTDNDGTSHEGYRQLVDELMHKYPIGQEIMGEEKKKEFVVLYSRILRLLNILKTFDEFDEQNPLSDGEKQHYDSMYYDIYDEVQTLVDGGEEGSGTNPYEDIVFEIDLVKQDEITIDRILYLVKQYASGHADAEIDADGSKGMEPKDRIKELIESSSETRGKTELLSLFLDSITPGCDVDELWASLVKKMKTEELEKIIADERLRREETYAFVEQGLAEGRIYITGTNFAGILPPMSRFSKNGNRSQKREIVFAKLQAYVEKYKDLSVDTDEPVLEFEVPET